MQQNDSTANGLASPSVPITLAFRSSAGGARMSSAPYLQQQPLTVPPKNLQHPLLSPLRSSLLSPLRSPLSSPLSSLLHFSPAHVERAAPGGAARRGPEVPGWAGVCFIRRGFGPV